MAKYLIHVEADLELEFEPWEGCVPEEYAEQVGSEVPHIPSYIEDGSLTITSTSVDVRKES